MPEGSLPSFPFRTYLQDTDDVGIAYYDNYLRFEERVGSEIGTSPLQFINKKRVALAARPCDIECQFSAGPNYKLTAHTRFALVGGTYLNLHQTVILDGEKFVAVGIKLGCVKIDDGRILPLSAGLRQKQLNTLKDDRWKIRSLIL